MNEVQPLTSLRLVQLDHLIQSATEEAYTQLQQLLTELPAQTDAEKKKALLHHLHATRQRLQRLHILLQWCHKAPAVAESRRVLEAAAQHRLAIKDASAQLAYLKQELDFSAVPAYDVMTAMHVLQTGTYDLLPTIIKDSLSIPLSRQLEQQQNESKSKANVKERNVQRMEFLLLWKLRKEGIPDGLVFDKVHRGQVTLKATSGLYSATLTLVPAPADEVTVAKYNFNEAATGGVVAGGVLGVGDGHAKEHVMKEEDEAEVVDLVQEEEDDEVQIIEEEEKPKQQQQVVAGVKPKIRLKMPGNIKKEPKPEPMDVDVAGVAAVVPKFNKIKLKFFKKEEPVVAAAEQTTAAVPTTTATTTTTTTAAVVKKEDEQVAIKEEEQQPEEATAAAPPPLTEPAPQGKEQQKTDQPKQQLEYQKWRWRLLSFQILPGSSTLRCTTTGTLPPLLSFPTTHALQQDIEARMWAAADIAQLQRVGRTDLVIVPSPPPQLASLQDRAAVRKARQHEKQQKDKIHKEQGGIVGVQAAATPGLQSTSSGGGGQVGAGPSTSLFSGDIENDGDDINGGIKGKDGLPVWANVPLATMHCMLHAIAGKAVLNVVVKDEARALETHAASQWKNSVKVLKATSNEGLLGIRIVYWSAVLSVSKEDLLNLLPPIPTPTTGMDIDDKGKAPMVSAVKNEDEDEKETQNNDDQHAIQIPTSGYAVDIVLQKDGNLKCTSAPPLLQHPDHLFSLLSPSNSSSSDHHQQQQALQQHANLSLQLQHLQPLSKTIKPTSIPLMEHLLWTAAAAAAQMQLAAVYCCLVKNFEQLGLQGVFCVEFHAAVFPLLDDGNGSNSTNTLCSTITPPYMTISTNGSTTSSSDPSGVLLYVTIDVYTGHFMLSVPDKSCTAHSSSEQQIEASIVNALRHDAARCLLEGKTGPIPDNVLQSYVSTAILPDNTSMNKSTAIGGGIAEQSKRSVYTSILLAQSIGLAVRRLYAEQQWTVLATSLITRLGGEEEGKAQEAKRISLAPMLQREIIKKLKEEQQQQQNRFAGQAVVDVVDLLIEPVAVSLPLSALKQPHDSNNVVDNNNNNNNHSNNKERRVAVLLGHMMLSRQTRQQQQYTTTPTSDHMVDIKQQKCSWRVAICKATRNGVPLSLLSLLPVPSSIPVVVAGASNDKEQEGGGKQMNDKGSGGNKRKREEEDESVGAQIVNLSSKASEKALCIDAVLDWCRQQNVTL